MIYFVKGDMRRKGQGLLDAKVRFGITVEADCRGNAHSVVYEHYTNCGNENVRIYSIQRKLEGTPALRQKRGE